jgi:hypothetical protein
MEIMEYIEDMSSVQYNDADMNIACLCRSLETFMYTSPTSEYFMRETTY